jgi:hypothetical protein
LIRHCQTVNNTYNYLTKAKFIDSENERAGKTLMIPVNRR